jgi:hypothetical protein
VPFLKFGRGTNIEDDKFWVVFQHCRHIGRRNLYYLLGIYDTSKQNKQKKCKNTLWVHYNIIYLTFSTATRTINQEETKEASPDNWYVRIAGNWACSRRTAYKVIIQKTGDATKKNT